jgi:hypothetical protein
MYHEDTDDEMCELAMTEWALQKQYTRRTSAHVDEGVDGNFHHTLQPNHSQSVLDVFGLPSANFQVSSEKSSIRHFVFLLVMLSVAFSPHLGKNMRSEADSIPREWLNSVTRLRLFPKIASESPISQ